MPYVGGRFSSRAADAVRDRTGFAGAIVRADSGVRCRVPPIAGNPSGGGTCMNDFINGRDWPLAGLHMPERVPDEQADTLMAQLEALYARAEPHVPLMDGAQPPRQSARFMAAYTPWSPANLGLPQ